MAVDDGERQEGASRAQDASEVCPSICQLHETKRKQIRDFLESLSDQNPSSLSQDQPDSEIRRQIRALNGDSLDFFRDHFSAFLQVLNNPVPFFSSLSQPGAVSPSIDRLDEGRQQIHTFCEDTVFQFREQVILFLQSLLDQGHIPSFETNSDPDPEPQHPDIPSDLTRENLQLYCRFENISPSMDIVPSTLSLSRTTTTSSPRDARTPKKLRCNEDAFDRHLRLLRIFDTEDEPYNLNTISHAIDATRADLPDNTKCATLTKGISMALNEATLCSYIFSSVFEPYFTSESTRMIFDAQWAGSLLVNRSTPLPLPKPDVTIGASIWETAYTDTVISLDTITCPVTCCTQLMVPTFTVEGKCFQDVDYARRQNRLNGATMLRNIQEIHRKVGNVGIRNLQVFTGIIGNETA